MSSEGLGTSSRVQNAGRNMVWGIINKILGLLLPFAVRTCIIYCLGVEYTGLTSLFNSILTVLSLAELGFSSAIVFSLYKPIAEEDVPVINAYLNYYRKCYRIIGSVILTVGIVLLPFLPNLISGDVPSDINIYWLYIIYLSNTVVSYYMFAYRSSIFVATQRMDIESKKSTIVMIIMYGCQIVVLMLFRDYYVYSIVLPIMTVVSNIITAWLSKKYFPKIKAEGMIDDGEKKVIYSKIKGLIMQKVGSTILSSVDTIVISAFLGLRVLGIYNNYYYIISALMGLSAVITNALIPSVGNSIQLESKEKNYEDFKFLHFLYILFAIFCTTCLFSLFQDFMILWVGESLLLEEKLTMLLCIYFYTYKMSDICSIYKFASGLWDKWKIVPLVAGIVNLILNIILTQIIGLYGILISTIVALVFIYLPFYCYPIFKYYFESNRRFEEYIVRQIIYFLLMAVISFITLKIVGFITVTGVLMFIIKLLITVCVVSLALIALIFIFGYQKRMYSVIKVLLKNRWL